MRSHQVALLTVLVAALGCGDVESSSDAATSDAMASGDAAVADASPPPDVDSCTPNQFIECANADTARYCNDAGDALEDLACGLPGCNESAQRCNTCVPNVSSCDGNTLDTCGADGLVASSDACSRACIAANGGTPAHCEYLEPRFLADVCDTAATEPSLVISSSASFDTSLDTNCNGGIVSQSSSPALCVVRYGTFAINSGRTLTAIGSRALAIVTDGDLEITGTLDAAASNLTHGPGGGTLSSGTLSSNSNGSGGAGFHQAGRAGGSTVNGGGAAGGATLDPLALNRLVGGPHGPRSVVFGGGASGGGGGGAVTLISCGGTVRVSGTIDAGGGGASGGSDRFAGGTLDLYGGGGGGAGGQVVFQGLDVEITGNLYANGGGGGGGGANDVSGGVGQDGTRSDSDSANGGIAQSTGGNGGTGGIGASNPGVGLARANQTSSGGGGGSTGYFFVYVPSGVTPTLTPNQASPTLSPTQTANTR